MLLARDNFAIAGDGGDAGARPTQVNGDRAGLVYHARIMAGLPIVVLTGPTGVGKTALALSVAARLDAEIVSADSRQVYRFMDVGTAKPSLAERAECPHWLIDVIYPDQPFTVVDFQGMANRAVANIQGRGKRVLVVGGSPHYASALIDGLDPPPVNLALREWLERRDREERGLVDSWLRQLDQASAESIEPRNRRRVVRAVEATLTAGRPFSSSAKSEAHPSAIWVGLRLDRSVLHARVAQRAAAMVAEGWLGEARMLLAMGYPLDLPALSATGYAEVARVIRGEAEIESALAKVIAATNGFIRRQETWLRRDSRIKWLDADASDLADQFLRVVEGA
jgi:tRNA dimethylallyltransferase